MTKRTTTVSFALLCCLALVAPAVAAGTPEQKCAASKLKAAGKKFAAEAKCHTKALGAGVDVDAECLSKAAGKFDDAFAKAELAGGCLHTADGPTIEAKLELTVDDVVSDLACGNGRVDGGETCDDDGFLSGDGCDSTCTAESGFVCSDTPSVCTTTCGDGLIRGAEECDDGILLDGDGCSSACVEEVNYNCTGEPSFCIISCLFNGAFCVTDSQCCSNVCLAFNCL